MIAVALLDDHAAVRVGLVSILGEQADLELAGTASGEDGLWALLRDSRPDVVVLDLHHPGRDGLELSLRITRRPGAPGVVLYTANADDALIAAGAVAGAGAVVGKAGSPTELLAAVRSVAHFPRAPAPVSLRMRRAAAERLDPSDRAIFAMRLSGDQPPEISRTLGLSQPAVRGRLGAIIARLEAGAGAA
jgi:DNA-binding NarL/FixJ family response regulator